MKRALFLFAVGALCFGSVGYAESFKRIKKEADFRSLVVDKKLTSDVGWMTVMSGGKTEGNLFDKRFAANWTWKRRMYCRNAVLGKQQLGSDCQVVKISGESVQFIREYGKGETGTMKLP